jgi:phytoene dehydrogenase-like protein
MQLCVKASNSGFCMTSHPNQHNIMKKNIIIVGSGIAGLTAGCYAQMNGYNASIFEMHSIPGGLCTAWKRNGYKWDLSMHFLVGSTSGAIHTMWRELGIIDRFEFHYHRTLGQIEANGQKLAISTDREKLTGDMQAISPADAGLIRQFTDLAFGPGMVKAATLKPSAFMNIGDKLKIFRAMFPLFRTFRKYGKMSLQEFAAKFKDPFLRRAVRLHIDSPGWPMADIPLTLLAGSINFMVKQAGVPLGGSQQVMFHLADRFKKLGGNLHFNQRVTELVIENNRVKGIVMEDGSCHLADEVIWAGDGHTLIYRLLKGEYVDDRIRNIYETWKPKESLMHVMVGVNRDLSDEPHMIIREADEPVTIAGREHKWLQIRHRCFDRSMAPAGKSAVEVWYDTEYEYWEELAKDRKAYEIEKKRIADYTIRQLDKRWPGFASQVEVVDVPTPHTYARYTGNYKGSPDGWCISRDNMRSREPLRKLPGLDGLSMIGQWTAPYTGVVFAAVTARQAIQLMCAEEDRRFVTSVSL